MKTLNRTAKKNSRHLLRHWRFRRYLKPTWRLPRKINHLGVSRRHGTRTWSSRAKNFSTRTKSQRESTLLGRKKPQRIEWIIILSFKMKTIEFCQPQSMARVIPPKWASATASQCFHQSNEKRPENCIANKAW